jgi:formate dehydrogenase subunit gamma
MAATTSRPDPRTDADDRPLPRFTRVERWAHWVNAGLFAIVMLTGAVMYIDSLALLVGNRLVVRTLHTYAGLAIPVAFLIALAPRWGRALRRDLGRLNRFTPDDRRWLRNRLRRTPDGDAPPRLGKFNPGQKLNAAFVLAAAVVMLATGSIMHWYEPFSDSVRRGATFTHDWFALGVWLAVIGHVVLALRDPVALRAMVRGTVDARWARSQRPGWYAEVTDDSVGDSTGSAAPPSQ